MMRHPNHPLIVADPKVLCGKPTLEGTRISFGLILDLLAAGWSFEEIKQNYPGVSDEGIRACLAFARDMVDGPFGAQAAE